MQQILKNIWSRLAMVQPWVSIRANETYWGRLLA